MIKIPKFMRHFTFLKNLNLNQQFFKNYINFYLEVWLQVMKNLEK
jgi:hypothetical protein